MYIDVHCHLTGEEFDAVGGIEKVVERAQNVGVRRMICSGFDLHSSIKAKALAERFDCVYFCAGFHPSEVNRYQEGDLTEIKKLCLHEKCVGVGEIGLDYHFENNPSKQLQKELFIRQLQLAHELNLPVILHSRDAGKDTADILVEYQHLLKKGGLMHCYSYSPQMSETFLKLGLHFSFGGTSTFKNAKKVQDSVCQIPATRLLTETDCPYLTPVPFRGTFPNQPENVVYVTKQLAFLKGVELETMQKQILENAYTLFSKLK